MPIVTVTLPAVAPIETFHATLESEISKAQRRHYRLPAETRQARLKELEANAEAQLKCMISTFTNSDISNLSTNYLTVNFEAPFGIGTAKQELSPFFIPGIDDIAPTESAERYEATIQEWEEATKDMWIHWNHGTLILTEEKPERGKKFVTPANALSDFLEARIKETIETSVKYGVLSYRNIDKNPSL
jgi:hypothetical protein